MKYGYNDYKWNEGCENWDVFCREVTNFNADLFQPFMKRKTYDEKDEQMWNAFLEMVEMMKEHREGMTKREPKKKG